MFASLVRSRTSSHSRLVLSTPFASILLLVIAFTAAILPWYLRRHGHHGPFCCPTILEASISFIVTLIFGWRIVVALYFVAVTVFEAAIFLIVATLFAGGMVGATVLKLQLLSVKCVVALPLKLQVFL